MLNRRSFFKTMAAAAVLDPERLLFVPGKKLISIPKPRPVHIGVDLAEGPDGSMWMMYKIAPSGQGILVSNGGPWHHIVVKGRCVGLSTLTQNLIKARGEIRYELQLGVKKNG